MARTRTGEPKAGSTAKSAPSEVPTPQDKGKRKARDEEVPEAEPEIGEASPPEHSRPVSATRGIDLQSLMMSRGRSPPPRCTEDDDQEAEEAEAGPGSRDFHTTKRWRGGGRGGSKKTGAKGLDADADEVLVNLDSDQLKQMFSTVAERNVNKKQKLLAAAKRDMVKWVMQLREGFSLCVYGAGSKRALLEQFARDHLTDGAVVVVNGFLPRLSAKHVVAAATAALTHRAWRGASPQDMLDAIRAEPPSQRLYLLVHNIDGPGLRSTGEQALLAQLAACRAVHLIASIDHVHAPLLWDKHACADFNWMWHVAHTYRPYERETRHVASALAGSSRARARVTPIAVLGNMVRGAREVFKVLAERQLDDPEGDGTSFPLLYRACRERFLVSNERSLQGMLTEFR